MRKREEYNLHEDTETTLYHRYLRTILRFRESTEIVPESPFFVSLFTCPYLLELASMEDGWKRADAERLANQDLFFIFQLLFPYPCPCAVLANRDLTVGSLVVALYAHYLQFYLTMVEYYEVGREDLEYYLYLYMHQEDHLREYQARKRKNCIFGYIAGSLDSLFYQFVAILQLLPGVGVMDLQEAKKTFFQQILRPQHSPLSLRLSPCLSTLD